MIAPSPDWFAGVSDVDLMENGAWVASKTVDVQPWDSGGDNGATYLADDADADPKQPHRAQRQPALREGRRGHAGGAHHLHPHVGRERSRRHRGPAPARRGPADERPSRGADEAAPSSPADRRGDRRRGRGDRCPTSSRPGAAGALLRHQPQPLLGGGGHHFARPGNRFWTALHASGLTPRLLAPWEERGAAGARLRHHQLVDRATARADELSRDELARRREPLRAKVRALAPARRRRARHRRLPRRLRPPRAASARSRRPSPARPLGVAQPERPQRALPAGGARGELRRVARGGLATTRRARCRGQNEMQDVSSTRRTDCWWKSRL